ncbi:MAG: histidine phosphatase family protein [Phycisphaerales bacterium]|nr:histidine phosphatase family protein [Phycisphaerales bacterium]
MELFIVRHAAAEERDAVRWPDDGLRPLTSRGRKRFAALLAVVADAMPPVDLVLSSGLVRAWNTAELLVRHLSAPAPRRCVVLEDPGSNGGPTVVAGRMLAPLVEENGRSAVAVVGHEPWLGTFAAALLGAPDGSISIRKGAILCLELPDPPALRTGRLRWLVHPRLVADT